MQGAAFFIHDLVLLLRFGVAREGVDALADVLKLGQLNNGLAEFKGLLADRVVSLSLCLHIIYRRLSATAVTVWQHFARGASENI